MHRFVLAVLMGLTGQAFAADAYFTSSGGGTWTNSAEWSNFSVPMFNTNVNFVGTAGGTVSLTQANFQIPLVVFNSVNRTIVGDYSIGAYRSQTIDSEQVFQPSNFYNRITPLDPRIAAPTGNFVLTKIGNGGLVVNGEYSSFAGSWVINAGTVTISADAILGSASQAVTLNGGGVAADASLTRFTLAHPLNFNSGTSTVSGFGTYSGGMSGAGNVRFGGSIESYLTAAATYSGATQIVGSGTAGLYLKGGGQLSKTSSIDVSGQLFLSSGADRIGDAVPVNIHAGTLTLSNTSNFVAASETIGDLSFSGGDIINVESAGGSTTLNVGALARNDHGTITLKRGSNTLRVSNGPSLLAGGGGAPGSNTISVLPFMADFTNSTPQLLTIDNGVVRPLASGEYLTSFTGSTAQTNVQTNSTTNLSAAASCNALTLGFGAYVNGPGTLTVTSGLIAGYGGTITAPLNFGPHEGVLFNVLSVTGPISGSGGLTIDVGGYVNTGTFNAANTYSGTTTINSGTVQLSADVRANQPSTFGNDSSAVVLSQGYSFGALTAPASITFARDLRINTGTLTNPYNASALGGSMNVSGNIQLDGPLRLDGTFSIGGNIAGPSSLSTRYPGYLNLSGNNTFAGGLAINGGTLVLGSNTALGSGTLSLRNSTTINANIDLTLNNALFFDPAATITLSTIGNHSLAFTGPVDLGGGKVTVDVANAATSFTGIVANGSLIKTNSNALRVGQLAVASLTVSSGKVQLIAGSPVSRVNSLSFGAGGTLDLTGDDLIVDYADASPAATIRSQIIAKQLFSSLTDARRAVGYGESGTVGKFDGQDIDTTAVLIKYTYLGDVNLDGKVDIADLGILASNWQKNGVWTDGDFDYSGKIDIADLGNLAANWQAGVVSPSAMSFAQALAVVGVPEPSILFAGLSLLALRRQRPRP